MFFTVASDPQAEPDPSRLTVHFKREFDALHEVGPAPPPLRTKWTRRVPHPVLIGHAASLTPY